MEQIKSDKIEKEENWFRDFKTNNIFRERFIKKLNKLGFPLEFKTRQKLIERGFNHVREGHFSQNIKGIEVAKSFDISASKTKSKIILNNITIMMNIHLVGDCKYSSDQTKFLLAIPETSNIQNKLIVGPILSNLENANRTHLNGEVVSDFISKYGSTYFASDMKDTSSILIMGDREPKSHEKIQEFEKIFDICEDTIIPALNSQYLFWKNNAISDYSNIFSQNSTLKKFFPLENLKGQFFSFTLFVPFVLTSKQILVPELNKSSVADLNPIDYVIYEHSVLNPLNYLELMNHYFDIGVFICNENGLDHFINYIDNMANLVFERITSNISGNPNLLFDNFQQIMEHNKRIEDIKTKLKLV